MSRVEIASVTVRGTLDGIPFAVTLPTDRLGTETSGEDTYLAIDMVVVSEMAEGAGA